MALGDRIQSKEVDFLDQDSLIELSLEIKRKGLKISLIDFSNTHFDSYLTITGVKKSLEAFDLVCESTSLVFFFWPCFCYTEREYAAYSYEDFKAVEELDGKSYESHSITMKFLRIMAKSLAKKESTDDEETLYLSLVLKHEEYLRKIKAHCDELSSQGVESSALLTEGLSFGSSGTLDMDLD